MQTWRPSTATYCSGFSGFLIFHSLSFTSQPTKAATVSGKQAEPAPDNPQNRRRAVEAARWIDAHSASEIDLGEAAQAAGLSPFHFLRVFSAALGVTPHQYLLRSRLRRGSRYASVTSV